jgi:hypothetical protein
MMFFMRRLQRRLDERVREAEAQEEESKRRRATTEKEVIRPLKRALEDNHFARLIQESIVLGHRRPGEQQ